MKRTLVAAALFAASCGSFAQAVATIGATTFMFEDLDATDGIAASVAGSYGGGSAYGFFVMANGQLNDNHDAISPPGGSGFTLLNGGGTKMVSQPLGEAFSSTDADIGTNLFSTGHTSDRIVFSVSANTRVTFGFTMLATPGVGAATAHAWFTGGSCAFDKTITGGSFAAEVVCDSGSSSQVFTLNRYVDSSINHSAAPVPEPSSYALLIAALAMLGVRFHGAACLQSARAALQSSLSQLAQAWRTIVHMR